MRLADRVRGLLSARLPWLAGASPGARSWIAEVGGCQTSAGERIPDSASPEPGPKPSRVPPPRTPGKVLRQRLAELRGPAVPPKALDARALAALAANPGCDRRALLDGAGVDKAQLADALAVRLRPVQFAFMRGNAFEARVKADGGAELLRLVHEKLDPGAEPPAAGVVPDLSAVGPEGRAAGAGARPAEATTAAAWTLLDHPMLALDVAGSPAFLEPDAVVVHPDGSWTVSPRSSPSDAGQLRGPGEGRRARPPVRGLVLALEEVAARSGRGQGAWRRGGRHRPRRPPPGPAGLPKDFSNLPTASAVDIRKQRAVTRRQLARLTRVEDIADTLPEGTCFAPASRPPT